MNRHFNICALAALAFASSIALSGCDDFLEAENKSAGKTADEYFSTPEGQAGYRVYAYSLLKTLTNSTYNDLYDDGSDIYWPNRKSPSVYNLYTLTAEDETVNQFYKDCYALANAANGLINYGCYQSEAKFLRSYAYYLLTQQFGSIPYVTEYINNSSRSYPRTDLKTIYDGMLQDLDDVLADASVADVSAHDGVVSKQAANALAAKVALAAGWDLCVTQSDAASGDYTVGDKTYFNRAANYAKAALANVSFYDNFADKWSPANDEANSEEFFSFEYDRASYPGDVATGGSDMQNDYGFYYGDAKKVGTKRSGSARGTSLKGLYLFDKGDSRYNGTFAVTHLNYDGANWPATGYYARYVVSQEEQASMPIAYYYAPWYVSASEFNTFLAANKARFVQGDCTVSPVAVRLGKTSTLVRFDANGAISSKKDYDYGTASGFLTAADGGCDCVCKWDDPNTTLVSDGKQTYRDMVVLHASETRATAAEALLMAGEEAQSLAMVNELRKRAGVAELASFGAYKPAYVSNGGIAFSVTPLDVVLDERARELYGEPGRWMDLRRTKQLVRYANAFLFTHDNIAQAHSDVKTLRPIPTDEINTNNAISLEDQNPGY